MCVYDAKMYFQLYYLKNKLILIQQGIVKLIKIVLTLTGKTFLHSNIN